jgi:hypothetical protein
MIKRTHYKELALNPKWFKVKIVPRKHLDGDVDCSYVSGHNKFQVKFDLNEAMNPRYFVQVREIEYDDIIKEISNAQSRR